MAKFKASNAVDLEKTLGQSSLYNKVTNHTTNVSDWLLGTIHHTSWCIKYLRLMILTGVINCSVMKIPEDVYCLIMARSINTN